MRERETDRQTGRRTDGRDA